MSHYEFIEQMATTEPAQVLCRMLHVSTAGYYQWLRRANRPTPAWEPAASAAFSRHAQRYGTRRLRAELQAEGHLSGATRCALGYAASAWGAEHAPPTPPYDRGCPRGVPLVGGYWCYVVTWHNTCSRRVVGRHFDTRMSTELVFMA